MVPFQKNWFFWQVLICLALRKVLCHRLPCFISKVFVIGFNPNTLQKRDVHWDKRRAWICQDEIIRVSLQKITFFKISYRCVQLRAWASGDFPDRSWVDIFEHWIKSHWWEHSLSSDKEQSPWRHPGWSRALSLSLSRPPTPFHMDHTHAHTKPARRSQLSCIGSANGLGVDRGCKTTYWQPSVRERNRNGTFVSNLRVNWWHEQSQMILGDTFITFFSSRNLPDSTGSCRKWLDAIRVSTVFSFSFLRLPSGWTERFSTTRCLRTAFCSTAVKSSRGH